jgi:hypothetical protein
MGNGPEINNEAPGTNVWRLENGECNNHNQRQKNEREETGVMLHSSYYMDLDIQVYLPDMH